MCAVVREVRVVRVVAAFVLSLFCLGIGSGVLFAQETPEVPAPDQPLNPIFMPFVVQGGTEFSLNFDAMTEVAPDLRAPIEAALRAAPGVQPVAYTISSLQEEAGWITAFAVPLSVVEAGWDVGLGGGMMLLGRRGEDGSVAFGVEGSPAFDALAPVVPQDVGSFAAPEATVAADQIDFRFPWPASLPWRKTQGWHGGWNSNAIDFAPVYSQNPESDFVVVAAAAGVVREVCAATRDPFQTVLRIDSYADGGVTLRTYYVHLDRASVPRSIINQTVAQGRFLGRLYTGTEGAAEGLRYDTPCGWGTGIHLHVEVPNRTMLLDGADVESIACSAFATSWRSTNSLQCEPGQFPASYYSGRTATGTPVFQRCESWPLNLDWGSGGPGHGLANDSFSARWIAWTEFAAGDYRFKAGSDDGMRVVIDGETAIDGWINRSYAETSHVRTMAAGPHLIDVQYFEATGAARVSFGWEAVQSPPTPTPTPNPTCTPIPSATPVASPTPLPSPTPSPSPTRTPTATPAPTPVSFTNPGFESGRNVGWKEQAVGYYYVVGKWTGTALAPYAGRWSAWLGGSNNVTEWVEQAITLPAGYPVRLYYRYNIASIDSYGYDWARVLVDGVVIKSYPLWKTSAVGGYYLGQVELAAWQGKRVTVRFQMTADRSYASSFVLDEIELRPCDGAATAALEAGAPPEPAEMWVAGAPPAPPDAAADKPVQEGEELLKSRVDPEAGDS